MSFESSVVGTKSQENENESYKKKKKKKETVSPVGFHFISSLQERKETEKEKESHFPDTVKREKTRTKVNTPGIGSASK